jgi:hypothetical protein
MHEILSRIVELAKRHGWKEQIHGTLRLPGNTGNNFFKDGVVLTVSMLEEGHMAYPDEDELKEMFGNLKSIQGKGLGRPCSTPNAPCTCGKLGA